MESKINNVLVNKKLSGIAGNGRMQEVCFLSSGTDFIEKYKKSKSSLDESFKHQYLCDWSALNTEKNIAQKCGDCVFFKNNKCSTSILEAKWGNFNTPACEEFINKFSINSGGENE